MLTDQSSVDAHPLIFKFMSGVFHRRPALPKYNVTWDADIVVDFLRKWSPANCFSLRQLSMKVVTLYLLVIGHMQMTVWLTDIRI